MACGVATWGPSLDLRRSRARNARAMSLNLARSALLLRARDVFARAGIDAQNLAFVDEQRHAHDGAGFELRRLLTAGRGVTAQAGIRLDDLEIDMGRRRHQQRLIIPQRHDADDAVLEPL